MREMYEMAPTSPWEEVKRTLEHEIGQPIEDVFESLDQTPVSSASIAQVHIGRLKNGDKVAVKIQHEWLKEDLAIDIKLTETFVQVGQKLFTNFNYQWLVDDMKKSLPQELDFTIEKNNSEQMKKLFTWNPRIKVPDVYHDLSTSKVLVMEYVDGINVDDAKKLSQSGFSLDEVSSLLTDCFMRQIFEYGVVHADPHSGNVFIRKDRKGRAQLVLLDHGLYKYLPRPIRQSYCRLWKGILKQDEDMIKHAVHEMGIDSVLYRLFAGMVTAKSWDSIMDANVKTVSERLHVKTDQISKADTQTKSKMWMKEILHCLQTMNQDLLLVLKVNDYLRTINYRLGQPIDVFYYTVIQL